jgi:autotransporter-associated beta strand protein
VTLTGTATVDTNGNNVTFANPIGNSGAGGFTKSGAGTLTLTAATNAYSGATTIAGGILSVSDNLQLGSGTAGIVFSGGTAFTNGGVLRITGSNFSTARVISNSAQLGFGIDVAPGATGTFTNTGGNGGGGYASGVVFGSVSTTANSPGGTLNYAGGFSTNNNNNGAGNGGPSVGVRFRNITANVTGLLNVGIGTANTNAGNITVGPGAGETTVVNLNGTGQFLAGGAANNTTNNVSVGGTPAGLTDANNTGGTALLPSTATLNINSTHANAIQAPNLYVAYNGTTTAVVNQNTGGVVLSNTLTLGNLGTAPNGTYNLGNGSASAASLTTPTLVKGAGAGTFNFNGGTLNATATSSATAFMGTGTTAVNATVDAGGAKINTGAFNVGIAQGLLHNAALGATDDGGLTKTGGGALTLNGANTYTGATAVNEGSLVVNGSLGASAVAVNSTGTLTGSGSFSGSVTVASGGHLDSPLAGSAASRRRADPAGRQRARSHRHPHTRQRGLHPRHGRRRRHLHDRNRQLQRRLRRGLRQRQ